MFEGLKSAEFLRGFIKCGRNWVSFFFFFFFLESLGEFIAVIACGLDLSFSFGFLHFFFSDYRRYSSLKLLVLPENLLSGEVKTTNKKEER